VLRGAADEVLAVLKNEALKDLEKKKDIEKLLNTMSGERFAQLVAIGKLITDFSAEVEGAAGQALDDEIGVAVEFEEDEDEGDSELDEVEVSEARPLQVPWEWGRRSPCCHPTLMGAPGLARRARVWLPVMAEGSLRRLVGSRWDGYGTG
jgi:hypothetical protein